jgi:hypothetical protein
MKRKPDWETPLADYLLAARERAYSYGTHDCLLHCASAVEAMTGEDLGAPHRGRYRTEADAARHLRRHGARTPEAFLDARFPEVPVAFARRGDIVLAGGVPGICVGHDAVFAGENGLIHNSRETWTKAWRVGE